jgi:hypothetical protein
VRAPDIDRELISSAPGPQDFDILHVQANQTARTTASVSERDKGAAD